MVLTSRQAASKGVVQKEILPTTRYTYRQAAQVLGRAFVDDPVSVAAYKNFSAEQRFHALMVDFSAEYFVCFRKGYPIHINENGRMAAAALIYPPGAYPLSLIDQWLILAKSVLGNGWYDLRGWLMWLREVDKRHPRDPHYYLEYIGVEPGLQGKGFGSTILEHLASKADELRVGCYLENANPRNVPFYQRFGFSIREELEIIGITTWLMWRPPGKN